MDQFLVKFMKERFNIPKISKRNIEQTLISVIKFCKEDTRIDTFMKFLGISENKYRTEILDCYLNILKSIPVSFFKLFEELEISSNILISFYDCMEIYINKFPELSIDTRNLDNLIKSAILYIGDKEIEKSSYELKKDTYFLMRFFEKSSEFLNLLLSEFKNNIKNEEFYYVIADKLISSNKEFRINLNEAMDIINRNFLIKGNKIILQSFFDFFMDKKNLKIKALNFIQLSLEKLVVIYAELEELIGKLWEKSVFIKNEIIFYKDFEKIFINLLGGSENIWKYNKYFR